MTEAHVANLAVAAMEGLLLRKLFTCKALDVLGGLLFSRWHPKCGFRMPECSALVSEFFLSPVLLRI